MLRLLALCCLCGCDILFQLQTVPDRPAVDASADAPSDATIAGLVAWFPMDDVASTFVSCMPDAIGHHDGTCVGNMPAKVPGAIDGAYKFDGMLNIRIADDADLDTPAFTVAYWQNLVPSPAMKADGYECSVNRVYGTAADDSWQVCAETQGTFWKVGDASSASIDMVQVGEWHHIAITFDGATFTIWLDGTSLGTGAATVASEPTDPIVLGMDLDGDGVGTFMPSATFDGLLDDLRFYNRALSPAEVAELAHR